MAEENDLDSTFFSLDSDDTPATDQNDLVIIQNRELLRRTYQILKEDYPFLSDEKCLELPAMHTNTQFLGIQLTSMRTDLQVIAQILAEKQ